MYTFKLHEIYLDFSKELSVSCPLSFYTADTNNASSKCDIAFILAVCFVSVAVTADSIRSYNYE